ncbi:MAG: hypothetical protein P8Y81_03950 [Ignavibacteriaceae bacterium]
MSKMNPVVHFELPTTSEVGEDRFPKQRGTINGGIYQKSDMTSPHPSIVISVDDINESIEKVKKAGGKVLGEPMPIPGVGSFVSFIDTEGNQLSMLQPLPMQ